MYLLNNYKQECKLHSLGKCFSDNSIKKAWNSLLFVSKTEGMCPDKGLVCVVSFCRPACEKEDLITKTPRASGEKHSKRAEV